MGVSYLGARFPRDPAGSVEQAAAAAGPVWGWIRAGAAGTMCYNMPLLCAKHVLCLHAHMYRYMIHMCLYCEYEYPDDDDDDGDAQNEDCESVWEAVRAGSQPSEPTI